MTVIIIDLYNLEIEFNSQLESYNSECPGNSSSTSTGPNSSKQLPNFGYLHFPNSHFAVLPVLCIVESSLWGHLQRRDVKETVSLDTYSMWSIICKLAISIYPTAVNCAFWSTLKLRLFH
uniref:Uncharacterized protein n=1 Tax=Cacopsylla melanoneura TaxID=428564 RepID=A0A8D8UAH2_9HEMI